MKTEAAVYYQLINTAGLTALVGARIYPVIREQDCDLPAVTYWRLPGGPMQVSGGEATLREVNIGIEIFATSYIDAQNVLTQIETALSGFSGLMGGAGGVTIQKCFKEDHWDEYEDDTDEFKIPVIFSVWAEEA